MRRDDIKTLIIVLLVCGVCLLIVFLLNRKSNVEKMSYVSDYKTFFSVSSEVNQFISYIGLNDGLKVFDVLDESYVKNNGIDSSTILSYFDDYSFDTSIYVNGIDYVKIGNNYLYLVSGKLIENTFDSSVVLDDSYMIIVLNDIKNSTYSIYPIENNDYKKIINSIRKINIDGNLNNKLINSNDLSTVEICNLYFSDFTNKLLNDVHSAYDVLNDDMKKRFASVSEFESYVSKNYNKITTYSRLCNLEKFKNRQVYNVIDQNNNQYSFSETGVMRYKVKFNYGD